MSVTRINHFEAKPGQGDQLRQFLESVIGRIRGSVGCRSCQLFVAIDQPERLAVVEAWDSVDAHQSAAKAIPPALLQEAMALLAVPPTGTYFRPVVDADA